jgi:predicted XRE-type DNA-binding protein
MAKNTKKGQGRGRPTDDESVTRSSGNVFADLGLADADALAAKADLARAIREIIEARGVSQRQVASTVGASQSDLSNLYRLRLDGFSIERLSRILTALGQDVEIVVQPKPRARKTAQFTTRVRITARKSA